MDWISGALAIGGALLQKSSADDAADQQVAAGERGLAASREMYDQARTGLEPYAATGRHANRQLSYLLGLQGGANPAIGQARNALADAQRRYDSLSSSSSSGPSQWIPEDSDGTGDWGGSIGHWASPLEMGQRGNVGGNAAAMAQSEITAAQNALKQAQSAPWQTPEGFGSLMEKFTGQDLYDDPGYQFRLDEGLKGLQNSAAARGNQFSGATMKGLGRYSQGYASNEFDAARRRFIGDQDQTVNYLTAPTQRGLQAAGSQASLAQNQGNAAAGLYGDMGNAQSAGTIAGGNALNSGMNQAYNAYQDSQQQQRLNALLRNNAPTYAPYGGGPGMYQGR